MDRLRNSSSTSTADGNGMIHGIEIEAWRALSDEERARFQQERRRNAAFKTALCKLYRDTAGNCPYGYACRFAHHERELRQAPAPHPKHKTQLCRNYEANGSCRYGARCCYIHRPLDQRNVPVEQLPLSVRQNQNFSASAYTVRYDINERAPTPPRKNNTVNNNNIVSLADIFAQLNISYKTEEEYGKIRRELDDDDDDENGQSRGRTFSYSCL